MHLAAKIRRFAAEGPLIPASFDIKSAMLPLVALLLKTADLAQVADELQQRFGEIPDFFENDPLVVDLTPMAGQQVQPDFAALLALLARYNVKPVAVRGGNDEQMKAAQEAGLALANDAPTSGKPAPAPAPSHALIVDKPLRSGQQVYARGRDLVVLSMVNPGAEVVADGSIHVYAPLRGKAIAGARGNHEARILSLCLEAELVSIAGVYRTSEVPLPGDVSGRAAQVKLVDDRLVFESLGSPPARG